jgi:2-oxoglutarate dehydrogenase complex dehydrogenase (E1) component-like enzyme
MNPPEQVKPEYVKQVIELWYPKVAERVFREFQSEGVGYWSGSYPSIRRMAQHLQSQAESYAQERVEAVAAAKREAIEETREQLAAEYDGRGEFWDFMMKPEIGDFFRAEAKRLRSLATTTEETPA